VLLREGRPGAAHLVVQHQADPRWPALPGALRIRPGAQVPGRTRAAAEERAAHHVAAALRDAARPVDAAGVDDPCRPVPVRPPGPARMAAGVARGEPAVAPGRPRVEAAVHTRLRIQRRLGRRCAAGGAERHRRRRTRAPRVHALCLHPAPARRRRLDGHLAARPRRRSGAGRARALVNATGPWAAQFLGEQAGQAQARARCGW
jgi:hypothetical protein